MRCQLRYPNVCINDVPKKHPLGALTLLKCGSEIKIKVKNVSSRVFSLHNMETLWSFSKAFDGLLTVDKIKKRHMRHTQSNLLNFGYLCPIVHIFDSVYPWTCSSLQ